MDPEFLAAKIQDALERAGGRESDRLPSSLPRIPDHELIARIGGGSYGDVWLARGITGRCYAVKIVWRQNFSSDRPFEREFSGIAQFEPISRSHPGVVNVLHVGRDDRAGCFFYTMELADCLGAGPAGASSTTLALTGNACEVPYVARTLAADLKSRGRLPIGEVLELGVQLANALGHLHRHGLVHRDVKPSNVIFVEGRAKLADIGLVAGADEARSFVGTEGFIPPEGPGTVRADLFALGRLLYEAATGKDRFEFPNLPPDLDRWPDRESLLELNEIMARCCAPKATDRQANAAELAAELNVILSGKSIRHAYDMERRLRRATLAASVAVLAVLLTCSAVWFQRMQRQRADARSTREALLRERAEESEKLARERLRESLLQQALALTASAEPDRRARALSSLRLAAEVRPGADLRNAAVAALATPELHVTRRWDAGVRASAGSRPDATLTRYLRINGDGTLSVLRMTDDAQLLRLPAVKGPADFGSFSPNGEWLAVKHRDATLRVWNLRTQTNFVAARKVDGDNLAFAPDNSGLAVALESGEIRCLELGSGQLRFRHQTPSGVRWLAWHPQGDRLGLALEDGATVEFLHAKSGNCLERVSIPEQGYAAAWSSDGRQLMTAQSDFSLRIWDWPMRALPRVISRLHRSEPIFLASDPLGRWWVTGGWDNQIYWLDAFDGRLLLAQPGDFVAAASDRPAFLWARGTEWTVADFDSAVVPETVALHESGKGPSKLEISPDGRYLATLGDDGVRILDLPTRTVSTLTRDSKTKAITFTPDSRDLYLFSEHACSLFHREEAHDAPVRWAQSDECSFLPGFEALLAEFGADRRSWVALARTNASQYWRWFTGTVDGQELRSYRGLKPGPEFPAISPDGRWLAHGNWRTKDAWLLDRFTNSAPICFSAEGSSTVAFSPDGAWFVVSDSTEARFFETGSFRLKYSVPRSPRGSLPAVITFSANSRLCAIVVPPDHIELIDAKTGRPLVTLRTPDRHVLSRAAFGQNDRLLAASSLNHFAVLWDLEKLRLNLRELGLDW